MLQSFSRTWVHTFLSLLLVMAGLVVLVPDADAQRLVARLGGPNGRVFPPGTFRGVITMVEYPVIEVDGKRERLAPGSRIMDTQNRIVLPGMFNGKRMVVNYARFANGQINTIWLLTNDEMKDRLPLENPSWWARLRNKAMPLIDLATWAALQSVL